MKADIAQQMLQDILYTTNTDALAVYMVLLTFRRKDKTCHPSLEQIAERANMKRWKVSECINMLEDNEFITRESGRKGWCNEYTFPNTETRAEKKRKQELEEKYKDFDWDDYFNVEPITIYRHNNNK